MARLIPLLLLAPLLTGCGGARHSHDAVERARQALDAALESWKKNEPTARLKSLPEPVEFSEELRTGGQRLVGYRHLRADATDPAVIRFTVVLSLQDRRARSSEREVTYSVALRSPIAVARDPYF